MGNAASKAGWLIFIAAAVGTALNSGPDDPITSALKSAGIYQQVLVVMWIFIFLMCIWMACIVRKTVAMRRHLDELRNRKGR